MRHRLAALILALVALTLTVAPVAAGNSWSRDGFTWGASPAACWDGGCRW
jgi:hypothetical protein